MSNKAANVDPIVLLALLVLISRRQSVSKSGNLTLVTLLVLVCCCSTILLSLRCIDHDSLSSDLLVAHRESHQDGLWRVKLDVGNSNNKNRVRHRGKGGRAVMDQAVLLIKILIAQLEVST